MYTNTRNFIRTQKAHSETWLFDKQIQKMGLAYTNLHTKLLLEAISTNSPPSITWADIWALSSSALTWHWYMPASSLCTLSNTSTSSLFRLSTKPSLSHALAELRRLGDTRQWSSIRCPTSTTTCPDGDISMEREDFTCGREGCLALDGHWTS